MATDPRNGQRIVKVNGNYNAVERFDPPQGLCAPAEDAWNAFWDDRQGQLMTPASKNVLLRWVDALNRYMIFIRRADIDPIIETGVNNTSLTINPAYRIASEALRTVEWCERQLGIGTLHATSLGLAAIAEARSITDLNARYSQPENLVNTPARSVTPAAVEEDPRLGLDNS
jgi:hypothetical protein